MYVGTGPPTHSITATNLALASGCCVELFQGILQVEQRRLGAVNALRQHTVFSEVAMALVREQACRPQKSAFPRCAVWQRVGLDDGRFGVDLLGGTSPTRVLAGARLRSHHARGQLQSGAVEVSKRSCRFGLGHRGEVCTRARLGWGGTASSVAVIVASYVHMW